MRSGLRIAGAPISWGVSEVPGWGHQMDAERVLREASELGLTAVEAGPLGFLPSDPKDAVRLLDEYGLRLVGGFVPAVLHRPNLRESELASIERQATFFSIAGADVLVLAASTGQEGYEETVELDDNSWDGLFGTLASVEEICTRHSLALTLHPHFGTLIERRHHVQRFLDGCETGLCLDTGHLMVGGSNPVEVAELAADRIGLVHLKDVDRDLAEQVSAGRVGYQDVVRRGMFKPLGEGGADIEQVVSVIENDGYGGWYVIEQDIMLDSEPNEGEGPVDGVRKSLAFVREQLGDVRRGEQGVDG